MHFEAILGAVSAPPLKCEPGVLRTNRVNLDVDYNYITLFCLLTGLHGTLSMRAFRKR
jgi:hypothetical protein